MPPGRRHEVGWPAIEQVPLLNVMIESDAEEPNAYAAYPFGLIVNCFAPGDAASR